MSNSEVCGLERERKVSEVPKGQSIPIMSLSVCEREERGVERETEREIEKERESWKERKTHVKEEAVLFVQHKGKRC